MIKDEDFKVWFSRDPYSNKGNEYPAEKITGVRWDKVSGGLHKHQSGYSLYGYIPYKDVAELLSDCSGQHDFGDNDGKICIPASPNRKPEYRDGYKMLLEKAGPKPSSSREHSLPPCTQRILELAPISRVELFKQLNNEGYTSKRISGAITRLKNTNKITLDAPRMSPKYTIFKV